MVVDYVKCIMNISLFFYFRICSREITDIVPCLKKNKLCLFLGLCLSKIFQTLHGYNFAHGLHFHCRFDDLDFVFLQGHRFVRNMNCKLCFLNSCLDSFLL